MAALDLGERLALALLELAHGIDVRQLRQGDDELEICQPVVRLGLPGGLQQGSACEASV
jgi:hypothetical protein